MSRFQPKKKKKTRHANNGKKKHILRHKISIRNRFRYNTDFEILRQEISNNHD